jgi:hypothetical protein
MKRRARTQIGRETKRVIEARVQRAWWEQAQKRTYRPSPFAGIGAAITAIMSGRKRG